MAGPTWRLRECIWVREFTASRIRPCLQREEKWVSENWFGVRVWGGCEGARQAMHERKGRVVW